MFLVLGFKVQFESVPSLSRGGQDLPGLDVVLKKFGFVKIQMSFSHLGFSGILVSLLSHFLLAIFPAKL